LKQDHCVSLTLWLHSSTFPRAHCRRNTPTDATVRALIHHRPLGSAASTGVSPRPSSRGRRRAPLPASTATGRSTDLSQRLPPPASEKRERCGYDEGEEEEEEGDLPRRSRIRAGGAPCAAVGVACAGVPTTAYPAAMRGRRRRTWLGAGIRLGWVPVLGPSLKAPPLDPCHGFGGGGTKKK
jgi:hypothetical protein